MFSKSTDDCFKNLGICRSSQCKNVQPLLFSTEKTVNLEIILRDYLVDILSGRVKNSLMLRTIFVSSDPMMLYALA
jgi:hypothetical protein